MELKDKGGIGGDGGRKTSSMDSSFPMFLPEEPCLRMSLEEFETYVFNTLPRFTAVESVMGDVTIEEKPSASAKQSAGNTFVDALDRAAALSDPFLDPAKLVSINRMLTENRGLAFASTNSALVDLFSELESTVTGEHLRGLLKTAWEADPLATLKIIWNARSIHLGKGERETFYMCLGWMKECHPRTLLANLPWIFRGVIEKDAKSRPDAGHAIVEHVGSAADDYEVPHGVSHGYWKDLLNILVLSVHDGLSPRDPKTILSRKNVQHPKPRSSRKRRKVIDKEEDPKTKNTRDERIQAGLAFNLSQQQEARDRKHAEEARQHERVLSRLATDPFHRALHITVARLFAEQLRKDMLLLATGTKQQLKELSLCAKWAPSLERFHDKHTLIATTIAELLFPRERIGEANDTREMYLKRAREHYRAFALSPIRKELEVVERNISSNNFSDIKYNQVPSLAMNQNKKLFSKKDKTRFSEYIRDVALGKANISGAVLTPGVLVKQALSTENCNDPLMSSVVDAQWNTLVQRIKDSGSLSDSIAVCDVSGSMTCRRYPDGTTPLETAMGLSLLLAEVTKEPFGGRIITFSDNPTIFQVGGPDDTRPFVEKLETIRSAAWNMNTNFLRVFQNLILPLAVVNKVKPDDMVKRIFVFSDMHFDEANHNSTGDVWATHHQIIEQNFKDTGYEVPQIVYWNLAGGRGKSLPKPVEHDTPGAALITGYSQALMKIFLDNGTFGGAENEGKVEEGSVDSVSDSGNGEEWGVVKKKKKAVDPLAILQKAIGHKAYEMLRVMD